MSDPIERRAAVWHFMKEHPSASSQEVSEATGIPASSARRYIARWRKTQNSNEDQKTEPIRDFKHLEKYAIDKTGHDHYIHEDRTVKKILSFGDLHCPFVMVGALRQALADHADVDVIAIPGDFADAWSLSAFYKEAWVERAMNKILVKHYNRKPEDAERYDYALHPILAELFAMQTVLDYMLAKTDAEIIICWGNHEARLKRYLQRKEVQVLLGIETDNLLDCLVDYDPRVRVVGHWHFSVNLTIFAHLSNFNKNVGKTASNCVDYFMDKHEPHIPFDSMVVPHTHMSSKFKYRGKYVLEPGALCHHSYGDDSRLTSIVSSAGYGVIVQEGGKTVYNESDFVLV